ESEENYEIVRTIMKLAQNLKMQVVAEGIETAEHLSQLNRLNCAFGQGYFISPPLEAERATKYIEENTEHVSNPTDLPVINLELNM
ncbi:MAG: EAL domain-containing protein, partial [Pyrinomonadaceae bacterium]